MYILLSILAELFFVSLLIILFYRLKLRFGLAPLYIFLGANQYFQTVLASSFYIKLFGGISVSPGSVILFSSSLFAILFIYIKEGVRSSQVLIMGIVLANFSITLLASITNLQEKVMQDIISSSGTAPNFFSTNFRIFFVGTFTLILDAFIMVILYEFFLSKIKRLNLFTRLLITLLIVLNFDSIVFSVGSFWGNADLKNIITSQLVSKSAVAVFFATVLYFYLHYLDNEKNDAGVKEKKGREDILSILTYKGKYEQLKTDKAISDEHLQVAISEKTLELENSIRRFTILSSISELRLDKFSSAEQTKEFLQKVKEAFGVDACTIHLVKGEDLQMLSSIGIEEDCKEFRMMFTFPYLKEMIGKKQALFIEDTRTNPDFKNSVSTNNNIFQYISCAGAPLISEDKVIGLLKLYTVSTKRSFSKLELEHLQLVGAQLANFIVTMELFAQNEKHKEVLVKQIIARKKTEDLIKASSEQLRQLTAHLQTIREEERKRIAREIHDDLGQQLTAIKMDTVWIDKQIPAETFAVKSKLQNIMELLDGSHQSVRKILNELRPAVLDDNGLLEALQWQGRQFTESSGTPLHFTTNQSSIKLPQEIATCIFRVYQESLTNIMRYAGAGKVMSSLNIVNDRIILSVVDDGKGFDVEAVQSKTSFGLLGMKERVYSEKGKFDLVSSPGKGTKIVISLPYKNA